MGLLGSIFKTIVETATCGNSDTIYNVSFVGFRDDDRFLKCFDGNGESIIKQICAFGLMRLIQENELKEYKDDFLTVIARQMPRHAAYVAQAICEGRRIHGGVRSIEKFVSMEYSCGTLTSAVVQVGLESGHRITFRLRYLSELFQISEYNLGSCEYVPGFVRAPRNY